MTTEIAVLNKLGIALATDSAVTIGGYAGDKIFDSADKLFELSPVFPVAVMINGNMDCLGVPWEIIIKDFREAEGLKPRQSIQNWMTDFLSYASSYEDLSNKQAEMIISDKVHALISDIKSQIYENFLRDVEDDRRPDIKGLDQFRAAIKDVFLGLVRSAQEIYIDIGIADSLSKINPIDICTRYGFLADDFIRKQFAPHLISDEEIAEFKQAAANMIIAAENTEHTTGVVIAGYGTEGIFPAIESVEIEGRVLGILKHSTVNSYIIENVDNAGRVVSYAQTDVIERLLGGADPNFVNKSAAYIKEAIIEAGTALESALRTRRISKTSLEARLQLIEQIAEEYKKKYQDETSQSLINEFTTDFDEMIALMPKQELVNLAEALVNITAVERKASADLGTVGGPIDVALITKHEGFVWIKRKQHFDPNLNPRYFWRRYGKNVTGGGYGTGASRTEAQRSGTQIDGEPGSANG